MTIEKQLIELLDNFQYELSDYISDNKYFVVDNHIELAKHLVNNGVMVQKHGRWIDHYTDIVCSECGAEYSDEIVFMNRDFECNELNYCPNCGAKMNKEM